MPLFLIERNFAEQIELTKEHTDKVKLVSEDVGVRWVYSFLSVDKRKSYCLYEAPNAEALLEHARRLDLPADAILEVGSQPHPEMFATA